MKRRRTPDRRRPVHRRPLSVSLARFSSAAAICAVLIGGAGTAKAALVQWDGAAPASLNDANSQIGLGGAGTWNTALTNWWTGVPNNTAANAIWNNGGFDTAVFGGTASGAVTFGAAITAGGLTFNTNGYTTTLTAANTLTLSTGGAASPIIAANSAATIGTAAVSGILGTTGFIKTGGGALTVRGNNTGLSGTMTVKGGTLVSSTGAAATTTVSALGAGDVVLNAGTFSILNNGLAANSVAPIAYANNLIVNGNSTFNANWFDATGNFLNNTISIPSLSLNNGTLTVTSGNGYGAQVAGTTTLFGANSTFSTAMTFVAGSANPTAGQFVLSGAVTGGALNKLGSGAVILQNGGNTYSGGTNIFAGAVILSTSTAQAGTGNIIVNPNAALAVTNANNFGSVAGQRLAIESTSAALGILRVDADADVTAGAGSLLTTGLVASPYGATVQVNHGAVNFSAAGAAGAAGVAANTQNMAAIGNPAIHPIIATSAPGNGIFLGAASNSILSGFLFAAADNVYRLGANSAAGTVLTISGNGGLSAIPSAFALTAPVIIGSPIQNVQTVANGTGTVAVAGQNATNLDTITVNRASTLQVTGTVAGSETPIGTGTVNLYGTLTTTASNYAGAAGQLGNTNFNLYQGGTLTVDNSAVTAVVADLRLKNTSVLNLNSGTVNYLGANVAASTTTQFVSAVNAAGGNTVNITTSATAVNNADAVLTIGTLARIGAGTVIFARTGTTQPASFTGAATASSDSRIIVPQAAAATSTNGILPAWMVDGTSNTFLTNTGANTAIIPVTFGAGSGATVVTNTPVVGNTYFAAVAGTALGVGTVTIAGDAASGSGLILPAAVTHAAGFTFNNEALIFANAATTITGTIGTTAAGLTKFGSSTLILTGANAGLLGTITVNQGILQGTVAGLNSAPVTLNAGTLNLSSTASGLYLNAVTVNGDSTIDSGGNALARLASLTINPRAGDTTTPVVLTVNAGGMSVAGTTTIAGAMHINSTGNAATVLDGLVTGAGNITKWGSQAVILNNGVNNFTGAMTINAGVVSTQNATASKPFASAPITINPGGSLRIAAPTNVGSNAITVNSDLSGLGVISMIYGGNAGVPAPASFTFNNGTLGGPFSVVLSMDATGFSGAINQNTFANGRSFLGSSTTTNANFTGALTPSTAGNVVADLLGGAAVAGPGNVYRLGGAGGTLNLLGAANQLTGANTVQIGAISNVTGGASVSLVNGTGTVQILNANNFSGQVFVNTGSILSAGNNGALGTGKIILNGGGIQSDTTTGLPTLTATRTLTNAIGFTGDVQFAGSTNLTLTSNFGLADGQSGVTRTFNVSNTAGVTTLSGNIGDGAGAAATNSITKTGGGPLVLSGVNSYSGYTNINAGTIVVSTDSDISPNSIITLNGGLVGAWNNSLNTDRNYILTGAGGFDVGAGKTVTQSISSNLSGPGALLKQGLGTLVLNGVNSNSGVTNPNNGILQFGANVNLGDPVANSAIVFGVAPGGALRYTGATVTIARSVSMLVTGALDVSQAGTALTLSGVISGAGNLVKTGAGTIITTNTNSLTNLNIANGTYQVNNAATAPFGATAALYFNGGNYAQFNTTANQAFASTGVATFGGGGHVTLTSAGGFSSQLTVGSLNRSGTGTLILSPVTNTLGLAGAGGVRLIPTTNINSTAAASANVNGILAPNIISETGGVGGFVFYNGAVNGLAPFVTPPGNLNATTSISVIDATASPAVAGNATVYAFRTGGNITGAGTIRIGSLTSTTEGGVLVNGNATISPNLIFDPSAISGGTATSGEGLLYSAPGTTTTVGGNVTANSFVKFGSGTLILNGGGNAILGELTVQEGILQIGSASSFNKLMTDLVLNSQAALDLNGQTQTFASLGNTSGVAGGIAGGLIGTSASTAGTFTVNGVATRIFAGRIVDGGIGAGTGVTSLVKSGSGTLTLAPFLVNNPDAGNNTFTGGTTVSQGSLVVQDPRALGTGAVNLLGGTLNLQSNGGGINGTIVLGDQAGAGTIVNVQGPVIINVDRVSANTGNVWQIGALNLSENTLQVSGANNYRLRVQGPTNILGSFANIQNNSDISGSVELAGAIGGAGALNKVGAASNQRVLTISGTGNTYAGGTNLVGGMIQVTSTAGGSLGTGAVKVYPGAELRIAGNGSLGGIASLQVLSRPGALGAIGLDADFSPTALNAANFGSTYGNLLAISHPFFTTSLTMATIGNGRAILGAGIGNVEADYAAATLGAGAPDSFAPTVPVYRVSGGVGGNLAFVGADNVLTGNAFLQVGNPIVNTGVNQTWGQGTVVIRNSNDFTGGTQIAKITNVTLDVGASPAGSTPLGTGPVEIYGTLQTGTTGGYPATPSFVNAATGKNANSAYILRPGGTITINDFAPNGAAAVVAGGQGRWADTDANGGGIDLNGGVFRFNGANTVNFQSAETVGTVTVSKGGNLVVVRGAAANDSATLNPGALTRLAGGTLNIATSGAGTLGIPTGTQTQFDRIIVSGGVAITGATAPGAGVVNVGIAAPWIVSTTDNSYVTYNPTVANTGFQSLVTGAPGANQAGYIISALATFTGGLGGGIFVVDANTAAQTLGDNPNIYALRTSQTISPNNGIGANTITIAGGGLLFNGTSTINPVVANTPLAAMTLAFGSAEALVFSGTGFTGTINAQITGSSGLTKFGAGQLTIQSNNPGLTGTVTVNAGTLLLTNMLGANGTAQVGAVNAQNVVMNGGALLMDGFLGNASDTAANALAANNVRVTTNLGSNITIAGDSTLTNNGQAVFQRFNNLTLLDLGARSPMTVTVGTGVVAAGTTTLGANNNNFVVTIQQLADSVLAGQVSGGQLSKYGNGTLLLASGANNYTGGTVINSTSSNNDAASIVGSLTRTGTPFGSGAITVNPGGMLRIADASNIATNAVTLNSDGSALAGLALAYNGPIPGGITFASTGALNGVLALDINTYSQPLNLATIGSGKMFLGTSLVATYFNATLGASAGVYNLGGGGNRGTLTLGATAFENVLTGGASVQIGAIVSGAAASGGGYVNGNIGNIVLSNRNNFSGGLTVNTNAQLNLQNAFAAGSGPVNMNNGVLNISNLQTIANPINIVGDTMVINSAATAAFDTATFSGAVNLAPNGTGGTRTFNTSGSVAGATIGFTGVISDVAGVSNVAKTSTSTGSANLGSVVFHAANTYRGTTTINSGFIFAGTDVLPNAAGAFGNSDTPILFGPNVGGNSSSQMGIAGQFTFGRDLLVTAAQAGTGQNILRSQTLNGATFTGGINIATGTALAIDNISTANGTGGVFDIQGPLTGAGALQIGTGSQGIVRLSANSNGLGTSTLSGAVNLFAGRVQIGADTYFTGTNSAPTIISGPLGTGSVALSTLGTVVGTAGTANPGGAILEAFGGSRVIVNPLTAMNPTVSTTVTFAGVNSLTFTSALDLNSAAVTGIIRTFNVSQLRGVTTFSNSLFMSAATGVSFIKTGAGTLVLSGPNNQINQNTVSDASFGTTISVSAGMVSVGADLNLGAPTITTNGTNPNHFASVGAGLTDPSDVRLAGGVLQVTGTFSTPRHIILTANSGIEVTAGNTLSLSTPDNQSLTGVSSLTKTGTGTLGLNSTGSTNTALIIGGAPLVTSGSSLGSSGFTGGTVSTTAISGAPFVATTGTVTINGGTLALLGAGANLSIATVNYGGGSYIQTNAGGATLTGSTGVARTGAGTLTLLPSAIANLGGAGTEKLISIAAPTTAAGAGGTILQTPSVYVRLAGSGQAADFTTYVLGTGFQRHTVTTVGTSLASTGVNVTDIAAGAADPGPGGASVTALAVRTAASINAVAGDQIIINTGVGGGLILNRNTGLGNAGVSIAPALVFGSVAAPAEALVHVADGTTSTPTISGNFTAANFTKSGPGSLLISGAANAMAPLGGFGGGLRTLTINEGSLSFAGAANLPSGGLINVAPQDSGSFEMAGISLKIGGLTGTGLVSTTSGTPVLTLQVDNQVPTFNGVIFGALALVKAGTGTQVLGYNSTYSGGTTIQAGSITSANGVFTSTGILQAGAILSLGTNPAVTIQGGVLAFTTSLAASQQEDNFAVILQGPGNGYDISVPALNNFGTANTTGTIATAGTNAFQAINSLTINAPVLTFSGSSGNGVLVKGATTLAGDTVLNLSQTQQVVLGGKIDAAGRAITKIGGATMFITNTDTGAGANSVGSWSILGGTVQARLSDGSSNPLGSSTPVSLNGGVLDIRHDGDNLADPQTLGTFAGNNVTVGSLVSPNSTPGATSFASSANSTLNAAALSAGANKTVQFGQLNFGGPLGASFFTFTAANNQSAEFTGGVTMIKDAYIGVSNDNLVLSGAVIGNGTLFKQGTAELDINTTSNIATGGTVLAGGTIAFANWQGNTRTLNTSTLAAGNVTVQPGAIIRYNSTANVNGAQIVDVRSNLAGLAVIGIADTSPLASYNARVPQAYGAFNGNLVTSNNAGSGVLAINAVSTVAVNLAAIGDGTWYLGSTTNGENLNGSYNAATLGAGASYNFGVGNARNADPVIRLAAGGQTLFVGSDGTANALSDITLACGPGSPPSLNVVVSLVAGAALTSGAGGTVANGTGTAILGSAQSYTGATLVNRGSTLEFRGAMQSGSYETFGTLNAGGEGGTFFKGATAITPVARPGSEIGLRNDSGILPVGATQGRYGDGTAVNLNGSTLRLTGSNAADIREVVGTVNIAGGSFIIPNRNVAGRITELNVASLNRLTNQTVNGLAITGNNGTLSLSPATGGQLGSDERVTVVGATLAAQVASIGGITNQQAAPVFWNAADSQWVTYNASGFVNAGFNLTQGAGTLAANIGTGTERLLVNGATVLNAGVQINAYSLAVTSSGITLTTVTDTTAQINVLSGGIISTATANIASALNFGAGGTGEGIIHVTANTLTIGDGTQANAATSGQIGNSPSIVKDGPGGLQLSAEQGALAGDFAGNIIVNGGSLTLNNNSNATNNGTSTAGGNGGTIVMNGAATTLNMNSGTGTAAFTNSIAIADGNPLVTFVLNRIGATSGTTAISGNLTFGGAPGDQGQTLTINTTVNNNQGFQVNGTVNLGPVGNAVIHSPGNSGVGLTTFGAGTTLPTLAGSGTLVKEGANQINLGLNATLPVAAQSSTNTGGIIIQQGTLQANALPVSNAANSNIGTNLLGTGNITLAGGQLNLRVDGDNSATNRVYTFSGTPLVTVTGSSTINVDRITAAGGTNKTLAFPALAIGGQTLTNTIGDVFSLRFNNVALSSQPTFTASGDLILGNVTDGGGALFIVKNGGQSLWLDGTGNTYSGGTYVNSGSLLFGNPGAGNTTAQAGSGLIQVNPGAAIRVDAISNINTGAGQNVLLDGINPSLAILRVLAAVTPANITTLLNASSTNGVLRIDVTYATGLNLAAIADGSFYLGTTANQTYSATTLGAGAGSTYRLGGSNATASVLTFTAANNNVLTGANRVLVGSLASNGTGTVLMNNTNDYSGGTTVTRGSTLRILSGNAAGVTPLGTGPVDVFGILSAEGASGSFQVAGVNSNAVTLHPGATLQFNSTVANGDRWADTAAISLDGATLSRTGTVADSETVGIVNFTRGSRIIVSNAALGSGLTTAAGSFTRNGNATMVISAANATRLGTAAVPGATSDNVYVTGGGGPASGTITNGMLPAYYISGANNSFVSYSATNGFTQTAFTSTQSTATFAAGLPATSIVDVTAAGSSTLSDNPNIYALRLGALTINNSPGQVNTITLNAGFAGGTGGGGLIFTQGAAINPNLSFNGNEGLIYTTGGITGTIAGDISGVSSAGITKFGTGTLSIAKDQTDAARGAGNGLTNGWTVNEGTLGANTFGALGNATGTNTVTLNGSVAGAAGLTLNANQGNASNQFYSMGNLNVTDNALITFTPGAADRTQSLGAAGALSNVVVTSTGGALHDAQLAFTTNQQRALLQVGDVSAVGAGASVILNVGQSAINNSLTSGTGSGLSVASLSGSADQIKKWGNAELYIRGASTFAGQVKIEQGPVGVFDNASLGSGALTVSRFGTVDVQVANYAPANSSVTYQAGSLERWSVNGARVGAVNLQAAGLQIANDQTGAAVAVTMNGGSIEGFIKVDDQLRAANANQGAVYRTLGSNVTFNFAGNSSVGQNITQGVNGLDNGAQPNAFSPLNDALTGVALEIKGAIAGPGSLTKQGFDMVTLSSTANTYGGGTFVNQGLLRAGATNALPVNGNLSTSGGAAFDLNGRPQQIGQLTSPTLSAAAVAAGGASGFVTNTATTIAILTLNATVNATYTGTIQYNVGLAQSGTATQTLANVNTYFGPTAINAGILSATVNGAMKNTASLTISGGTFDLGGGAAVADRINDGAPLVMIGGTIQTNGNSETLGTLTLGTGTSIIDMAAGASTIKFWDSSLLTWSGSLQVWNWTGIDVTGGGTDQIKFGETLGAGLTAPQLASINFYSDAGVTLFTGYTGAIFATVNPGEVVPTPEPSTVVSLLSGIAGLLGLKRFRRHPQRGRRTAV